MGYHSIIHSGSHSGSSSDISSVISLDSGYHSQISGRSGQSSLSGDIQSTKTTSHNTLRGYRPALQQVLVDKHLLIELAEELNKTDLINSDALAIVQEKENREGVDIILNLLEMKVAQEPDKLKDVDIIRKVPSLRRVFKSEKGYSETYIYK